MRVLSAAALLGLALSSCSDNSNKVNVLLITMDTTRADYLSCYGSSMADTPNLDALGADGVRFNMTLSASSVTPVSHATILTGEYPYNHGLRVLFARGGFRLNKPSIAKDFKDDGYRTLAVHSSFAVSEAFGFNRDFDIYENFEGKMKLINPEQGGGVAWDVKHLQRRSDETTDLALETLDGTGKDPFFMWMHYWDPHDPVLKPPSEFIEDIEFRNQHLPFVDQTPIDEHWDKFYAREVNYLDQQIGRLIDGLKERGLYENTVIVITADHGEGLSDGNARHNWPSHRHVYQEQVHVPLLMRAPSLPKGVVIDSVATTADIAPTILDLAGFEIPEVDGHSLRSAWQGEESEHRYVYADQINGYDINATAIRERPDMQFLYMIADSEWKLIYRPATPGKSELFNIKSDPLELQNVAAKHPVVRDRMLQDLAVRNPWVLKPFAEDKVDASIGEIMGQLGYTEGDEEDLFDSTWEWACPSHPNYRAEKRGRHILEGEEECREILILVNKD